MSIAFESNRMDRSGFDHTMSFKPIFDPSDSGHRRPPIAEDQDDSCSSSSIGKNSDVSGGGSSDGEVDSGDGEVQSSFKGPLDCLDSLEQVLPLKRGISSFYSGKSKSYTSLADVSSCSSIKDIVKQEDAYTRKRKNLLAHSNYFDKSWNRNLENSSGISKRLANSSRSSIALSAMVSGSESNNSSECLGSNSSSPTPCLPPLPPNGRRSKSPNNGLTASPPTPERKFSPWRRGISSFFSGKSKSYTSLADVSSCSSIKDIVKQEDAYTRERKNLLVHSNYFDKSRNRNLDNSSGISKRLANSSRSSISLSAVVSGSESNNSSECLGSNSSSPTPCLPPLPPNGRRSKPPNNGLTASPPTPERKFSPWRSFSLSDLQHAATATTESALVIDKRSVVEE